jgi:hypothetical protein
MVLMVEWKSKKEPPKSKAELREILADAVRNTPRTAAHRPKRLLKAKKGESYPAARPLDPLTQG